MSDLKAKAINFAEKAHAGQVRKVSNEPYIYHPLNVAKTLEDAGFSEEVVIAGILHDTVEDTEVEIDDIKKEFGSTIAGLVASNTETKHLTWEERKEQTIKKLADAPIEIKALIVADKLDNLRQIKKEITNLGENAVWSSFKRGKEKQRWYYEEILAKAFHNLEHNQAPTFFYQYKKEVEDYFL